MGDVGGVITIFIDFFSIFFITFHEFFFKLKIFQDLYKLKNKSTKTEHKNNLFIENNKEKISLSSKMVLYIDLFIDKLMCSSYCKFKNKMKSIYYKCEEFLDEELDLVRIIKLQRKFHHPLDILDKIEIEEE